MLLSIPLNSTNLLNELNWSRNNYDWMNGYIMMITVLWNNLNILYKFPLHFMIKLFFFWIVRGIDSFHSSIRLFCFVNMFKFETLNVFSDNMKSKVTEYGIFEKVFRHFLTLTQSYHHLPEPIGAKLLHHVWTIQYNKRMDIQWISLSTLQRALGW